MPSRAAASCLILPLVVVGCVEGRLDSIESRLAVLEQRGPTSRPASLDALVDSARVARARRDVLLVNLANVDTHAYKRRDVRADPQRPGETIVAIDTSSGPIRNTDRQLDVAIDGRGFLRVKTSDGVAYTRLGNLFVNDRGELVLGTGDGARIEPPIVLPNDAVEVNIADDGTVEVVSSALTRVSSPGRLQLATFVDDSSLRPDGPSLFRETEASGPPVVGWPKEAGFGEIRQGHLERGNVDALAERARLVEAERELAWIERTIERYEDAAASSSVTSSSGRPAR